MTLCNRVLFFHITKHPSIKTSPCFFIRCVRAPSCFVNFWTKNIRTVKVMHSQRSSRYPFSGSSFPSWSFQWKVYKNSKSCGGKTAVLPESQTGSLSLTRGPPHTPWQENTRKWRHTQCICTHVEFVKLPARTLLRLRVTFCILLGCWENLH